MPVTDGIGPDREERWRTFAHEIGATYRPGDFWEPEQIITPLGSWQIVLWLDAQAGTTGRLVATRLRTDYRVSNPGLTFSLCRTALRADVTVFSGNPLSLSTGDSYFDSHFQVTGNDPDGITALLANAALRDYLNHEPQICLESTLIPGVPGQATLTCLVVGAVDERSRLLRLIELMGETLQHLCATGWATDTFLSRS